MKFGLGMIDGFLIRVPNEMFWLLIGESGGNIGFAVNINKLGLPIRESSKLFLNKIFKIITSEVSLNIFGDRGKNLVNFT